MAIKMGHSFPPHTFTGSAGKDVRPTIPGYKHGGGTGHDEHGHVHHAHDAKAHYGKHGHVDHDGEHSHSKVHYDEHGFQHHEGMKKHKKGGMC